MNNRVLFSLTLLVLLGMLILFGINMTSILTGSTPFQPYLDFNQVRGIDVNHRHLSYTLNFAQQNEIIEILNRSVKVMGLRPGKHQRPAIERIVIHRFHDLPALIITPVAYVDQNLVFSIPDWDAHGYLMELSEGRLQNLLAETYDP